MKDDGIRVVNVITTRRNYAYLGSYAVLRVITRKYRKSYLTTLGGMDPQVFLFIPIINETISWVHARVSFETSFDSKQPKLEPKLVSALSETKRLFRLFRFYTETASFGVSIKPKQTEGQPKQTEKQVFPLQPNYS